MRQPKQKREPKYSKRRLCPDCGKPWGEHEITVADGRGEWKCPDE